MLNYKLFNNDGVWMMDTEANSFTEALENFSERFRGEGFCVEEYVDNDRTYSEIEVSL